MRVSGSIISCLFILILLNPPVAAAPLHTSVNGIVSIEAENYRYASGWRLKNYYTGIGITPVVSDGLSADSLCYTIDFKTPGRYRLYLLGNRKRNSAPDDNVLLFTLYDIPGNIVSRARAGFPPVNAPVWSSTDFEMSGNGIAVSVPDSGKYCLAVKILKGDGYYLDKIVLSGDPDFSPSGTGPEETCNDPSCATGARDRIIMPPRWVFGVLYGGYTDQNETLEVIDSLIDGDFPVDAYWIDSYFWDFNKGSGPRGYIDFVGDTAAFPDIEAMWQVFERRKIRAGLWIWNLILKEGNEQVFREFDLSGYFSGTFRYTSDWHNKSGNTQAGTVDFENPRASVYWKSRLKPFFDKGLDFLKLDNSSSIPFCRTAFEATQEMGRETGGRGFILAHIHTTYDYRNKLYPTRWTGDAKIAWTQPDYPDLSLYAMGGLKENIAMISDPRRTTYEIPFLSHDAGGYDYFGSQDQSEELYMRWVQFSSMNSIMMFFSHNDNPTRNHPYRYSSEIQQNFRKYTHLRMRLFPYLYTYALKSCLTGVKMIRGDADHELQYLLGEEILVAPVCEKGAVTRQVYLPGGTWIDPDSGKEFRGGREVVLDAPVQKLPMLIRKGAIIPMRNYARAIDLGHNDTLTLEVYPSAEKTEFELLEDDGLSNEYLRGRIASTRFTVQEEPSGLSFMIHPVEGSYRDMKPDRTYILKFHSTSRPVRISINGQKPAGIYQYDPELRVTRVELSADKKELQQISVIF